jgi:hypothetical protein
MVARLKRIRLMESIRCLLKIRLASPVAWQIDLSHQVPIAQLVAIDPSIAA